MSVVSLLGKIAANSPYSDQAILCLLTATHSVLGANSYRVTNNTEAIVSRGLTYTPMQFEIFMVDEKDDELPTGRLRVSTIGTADPGTGPQSVVEVIRSVQVVDGPIKIKLEFVLSGDLESPIMDAIEDLEWVEVTYNDQVAEGRLVGPSELGEGLQSTVRRFTPLSTPGLFV